MKPKAKADDAFAMYRIFLWTLGVWPLEKHSLFKISRLTIATIAQATFAVHTTAELYLNNGEIAAMVDVVLFCSSAYLTLAKMIGLHVYRDKIAENLESYRNDWADTKDENSLRIMRDHLKVYRYQFILYNSCGYIGTTMFVVRTIVANLLAKRQLGVDDDFEYVLACQTSFLSSQIIAYYYIPILAVQFVQLIYCCTSGACTDCFFFCLVYHLSAQFKILKVKWQTLEIGEEPVEDQRAKVIELIKRHKQLIKLGENLEASFNNTVLIQLMTSIILVCVSGCSVLVSLMSSDYITMIVSTNCICFMMTESFIYGYASEYLDTQSQSIIEAAYANKWYQLHNSLKKDLIFVMMRAEVPLSITAGKFFYVTRNTIVVLLKTSFSFLSVLRLTLEKSAQQT
ncbi:odorant receptor 49a-like [Phymastichus coffea]|uniref:odorant receptor 49a-like n=1 Tax=Phymastichus coffea TaxID=108790 RepID=UPI00273B4591|nr:odorant receptor 49a-like [Phymastichus coffea]